MQVLQQRAIAVAYWVIAFVLSVLAGVGGAVIARDSAPEFSKEDEGAAATSGARVLFGAMGFAIAGLAVAALFAGAWMLLWIRQRRTQAPTAIGHDDPDHDLADLLVDEDGAFIDEVADPTADEPGART
ncbi:hypothetical protein [Luteipulveratus mongoliensis]|uniref:Uncharacterized protein n=1 Tax=Luteipulveratus mongoliensis TaxID=571913 RepID=A0A0K1JHE3_9MICO|nr:hypothetical protein [Luteipulveratus mongoliensis]AKU16008.1 hypothetical protein VV02_09320 [Luteipulveratus mongoliensis]